MFCTGGGSEGKELGGRERSCAGEKGDYRHIDIGWKIFFFPHFLRCLCHPAYKLSEAFKSSVFSA